MPTRRPGELSRRTFLQTTGIGALAPRLFGATYVAEANPALAQTQTAPKPNILFMLVDNLGYGELGVYGGGATRGAPTPRIKQAKASASSESRLSHNVKRGISR